MKIRSNIKNYIVEMADNLLDNKKRVFSNLKYGRIFYFVDESVYNIYGKKLKRFIGNDPVFVIRAAETNKEYVKLAEYYHWLIKTGFTRSDILVTFGGGILQDISGFIASTLYRGIRWIFFPTTLLAQADSCIGSKTSVNFEKTKNLIGTFYPPDIVYIDSSFCRTLTDEYFTSGIGEIIKFHLMSDGRAYEALKRYLSSSDLRESPYLKKIILSTLAIKKSYFKNDEFDTGRRNLLNYGHCLGHALESASDFAVSHGEAVIIGMAFANLLSVRRGLMTKSKYCELDSIFKRFYPKFDLSKVDTDMVIKYLRRDKKRIGKDFTMILCEDIGKQVKCGDIKESEARDAYAVFKESWQR